jgi:hypothetical protein
VIVLRHQIAGLLAAGLEGRAAIGTGEAFPLGVGFQLRRTTHQGRIFQHPCPHPRQAFVQGRLDLTESGSGMLQAPFLHAGSYVFSQFMSTGFQVNDSLGYLSGWKLARILLDLMPHVTTLAKLSRVPVTACLD